MKTLSYLGCVVAISVSSVSLANPVNQAALQQTQVSHVKQALLARDDQLVQLKGYITKALGNEKYEFRDQTGHITVDIDDELWQGKAISATTPVVIFGEVDIDYKPMKRIEIDVDRVQF
ncbi:NirD/YgiW/YdeI family stress tolerance protein [Acinetobacter brisouii]|uniref:NirD/YgiW/YdeI family stress tolerance protein n=1 Tax=Acinetobacter brisouii TaxID=396323 RepID=UPI00124F87AD|nr:NirD/YgiW/YdeI family stress tolerance protein [Acinetobacter brisouii]